MEACSADSILLYKIIWNDKVYGFFRDGIKVKDFGTTNWEDFSTLTLRSVLGYNNNYDTGLHFYIKL